MTTQVAPQTKLLYEKCANHTDHESRTAGAFTLCDFSACYWITETGQDND